MAKDKTELCVTSKGLILILLKTTPSEIKDLKKRKRIIRFQRWAAEVIVSTIEGTSEETLRDLLVCCE